MPMACARRTPGESYNSIITCIHLYAEELPNLEAYVERVRRRLWADWGQCVDPPWPFEVQ